MNIIVILLTAFSLNSIIKRTAIVMVLQSISVKCGTVTRIKVKCLYHGKKGSAPVLCVCAAHIIYILFPFFPINSIVQKSHLICAISLKYLLLTGEMGVCISSKVFAWVLSVAFIIQISSTAMGEAAL